MKEPCRILLPTEGVKESEKLLVLGFWVRIKMMESFLLSVKEKKKTKIRRKYKTKKGDMKSGILVKYENL